MKEIEELELVLKLIGKYCLPLSPILEYAVKEKMEECSEEEQRVFIPDDMNVEDKEDFCDDEIDILPTDYNVRYFYLAVLTCIEGQIDKRSYEILRETLKGETRKAIAEKHRLTQERIRQIVVKATKQAKELLEAQRKSLEEVSAENARLKVQIDLLKEDVDRLKSMVTKDVQQRQNDIDGNLDEEVAALLETPVKDVGLSARASNILHYMGVKKFADIPQIESVGKLRDMRNSGRKTVHEVSRLLGDFYLTFGMSFTEMVDSLTTSDWQSAKRRWIKGKDNESGVKERMVNNTEQETSKKNNTDNENAPYSTRNKENNKIGCIVKLFPSQQIGVIVNSNVDKKGTKKLVVRTNEGNTMAIDDSPYLYEVLKRNADSETKIHKENHGRTKNVASGEATIMLTKEIIEAARTPNGGFTKSQLAAIGVAWPPPQDWIEEKVGTMISPSQLETFNRIEYVSKPLPASFRKSDLTTYENVVVGADDRRKMEAILQAMTHFYAPATPRDIARTVSRTAWGSDVVHEDSVDSFLKRLPEVDYIQWGKYILKSRNKQV